jgi:hypothetical protein
MDAKQMMEALVAENTELKKQLKEGAGVPAVRYAAAKKLIEGLVKRVKVSEAAKIKAESKVKASIKLIHKLVSERKAPTTEGAEQPAKPVVVESTPGAEVKPVVTKESEERRARLRAPAKPVVPEAKAEPNIMSAIQSRLNG